MGVPIIISLIGLSIILNEEEKDMISEENIIEMKNFEEIETQEIKNDDEIFLEIEEKYNQIVEKNLENEYNIREREWQKSGPFSIDRKEYALGEKIFLVIQGLQLNENGQIAILKPLNQTHYSVWKTFPFDGKISESFNVYFEPKLLKLQEICDKNDLLGNWVMVFRNTDYENIRFKIIDSIVPGDEELFNTPVC